MSEPLRYEYGDKTILELQNLQEHGHMNLEPGFQRKSVWTERDRRKLIESVLEGYPIPSIFLYRREEDGIPVYDVIDGKQRLESIFMFTQTRGFKHSGFQVRFRFDGEEGTDWYGWRDLRHTERQSRVLTYKIQTVEVSGDFGDIVDLFVRINSTGKALTSSEVRHARYFRTDFLKQAERMARRTRAFLSRHQIIKASQVSRMKDVELICELIASIANEGPIDRKAAVDRAVGGAVNQATLRRITREYQTVIRVIGRIFPNLRSTRFRNIAEFYSLFMVVWHLWKQRAILTDRRRNRLASEILTRFSNEVDAVREAQKRARGIKPQQRAYTAYLLSVQQSTDKLTQRKQRADTLNALLASLFRKKDEQRLFSPEQRRILWNSEEKKSCRECGSVLSWVNFQVDHVRAYSKGGRTNLRNAALTCRPCNASKGARRRARKR